MLVQFGLKKWVAVAPDFANLANRNEFLSLLSLAELSEFPRLLRRRLGRSGRLAIGAIESLHPLNSNTASIFASRHGEVELTHSLLLGIAEQQAMSPMAFSMSVHNAVGGIFTIAQKNTSPLNAIAASDGLMMPVLFEAATQLETSQEILCVLYDAPIHDVYQDHNIGPEVGFALAFVLTQNPELPQLSFIRETEFQPSVTTLDHQLLSREITEFVSCLEMLTQKKTIYLNHAHSTWRLAVA